MASNLLLLSFCVLTGIALALALYPLKINLRSLAMLPVIMIMIGLAYRQWGAWPAWYQYQHEQVVAQQARQLMAKMKSPDELIQRLKARLAEQPDSAKGWYLLGRLHASQGQWLAAKDAFETAKQLNPADEATIINYIQSVWQLNQQQFNAPIRTLLTQMLLKNANQPDALAMLAMDAFASHDYARAEAYWRKLLQLAPKQSPEAQALQKAIVKAQRLQQQSGH